MRERYGYPLNNVPDKAQHHSGNPPGPLSRKKEFAELLFAPQTATTP